MELRSEATPYIKPLPIPKMLTNGINDTVIFGLTPIERISFVKALRKPARKNVMFITIRDPKQNSKWITMGKIQDWIRKYSTHFYIVRGTHKGIHFHLMAIINKKKEVKYQKGIHFHTYTMEKDVQTVTFSDYEEVRESKDKAVYYRSLLYESISIDITLEKQQHIASICKIISDYWRRKNDRLKRCSILSSKDKTTNRILDYMRKNLEEPRTDELPRRMYIDFLYKS